MTTNLPPEAVNLRVHPDGTRQAVLCVMELAEAVAEDSQAFQLPPGYPPPPPTDAVPDE